MIYISAAFFGLGLMHLIQYMWRNYTEIVMGTDIAARVAENTAADFIWSGSYILFAALAVFVVSIPAAKRRDITYAAINGLLYGVLMGLGFAVLVFIRGGSSTLLDVAGLITVPAGIALIVSLAGYFGGVLSQKDVLARLSRDRGLVLANDNEPAGLTEDGLQIEQVRTAFSQFARTFDASHTTRPVTDGVRHADVEDEVGPAPALLPYPGARRAENVSALV